VYRDAGSRRADAWRRRRRRAAEGAFKDTHLLSPDDKLPMIHPCGGRSTKREDSSARRTDRLTEIRRHDYEDRIASNGSIRKARRVGITLAATTNPTSPTDVTAKTIGSAGPSPNSIDRRSRVASRGFDQTESEADGANTERPTGNQIDQLAPLRLGRYERRAPGGAGVRATRPYHRFQWR
jgi:hypothetical protein